MDCKSSFNWYNNKQTYLVVSGSKYKKKEKHDGDVEPKKGGKCLLFKSMGNSLSGERSKKNSLPET